MLLQHLGRHVDRRSALRAQRLLRGGHRVGQPEVSDLDVDAIRAAQNVLRSLQLCAAEWSAGTAVTGNDCLHPVNGKRGVAVDFHQVESRLTEEADPTIERYTARPDGGGVFIEGGGSSPMMVTVGVSYSAV